MFMVLKLIFVVGLFGIADITLHNNNLKESFIGRRLDDVGGLEYAMIAYEQAAIAGNKTAKWMTENVPVYIDKTKENMEPYAKLARDSGLILYNMACRTKDSVTNYVHETYPASENWVKETIPVLRDSIYDGLDKVSLLSKSVYEGSKTLGLSTFQYMKTNVFVGKLSPEYLQRTTIQTFNTVQGLASSTVSWVYEKTFSNNSD